MDEQPGERIFAYRHGDHDAYWCSEACKDTDCEFGPCCVPRVTEFVPYEGDFDVL